MHLNEAGNKANTQMFQCRTYDDMPIMSYCLVFLATMCMLQSDCDCLLFLGRAFHLQTYLVYNECGEQSQNVLCCHHIYNFWHTGYVLYRLRNYATFQTPRYNVLLVITVHPETESGSHATANCKNLQELHILSTTKHHLRTLYYPSVAPQHKSASLVLTHKNLQSIEVWII